MAELKNTPLREFHLEMGAKMVPRSGWNLPLNFSEGAADEHEYCRNKAALFDFCADGRYRIAFPGAAEAVVQLLCNKNPLLPGSCRRDFFVDPQGKAAAFCTVSLMAQDDFFITVPFQCTARAEELFNLAKIEYTSLSEYLGCIGISGPESRKVLEMSGVKQEELPAPGETKIVELDGLRTIVSFSDLFGEEGFEINFNAECSDQIWDLLLDTEIPWPAGLAAQESLRIEAGFPGVSEISIPGKAEEIFSNLAQISFTGRRAPFAGVKLFKDDIEIGTVTTGAYCPTWGNAGALAFFPAGPPENGTELHCDATGVQITGVVK